MQTAAGHRYTALPLRDHTILGVCEAIGEDFGFNPTYLRVPLAACVLVSLKYAVIAYFALGLVVLTSRLLFPQPKIAPAAEEPEASSTVDSSEPQPLPIAA